MIRQESYTTDHIGEKIREMRLRAGLTQAQLAEDFITRNMLSCIENGTALPSLPTLLHIARKLGVSPAFFLSGDDEAGQYRKLAAMPALRESFRSGQYEETLRMCRELSTDGTEITEMIFSCLLMLADKARSEHRLAVAAGHYRELLNIPDDDIFLTKKYSADAAFYLALIASVMNEPTAPPSLLDRAPHDWAPFLRAEELFARGDVEITRGILCSGLVTDPAKKHYLDALLHMADGDYLAAIPCLQMITSAAKPEFYTYYHALEKLEFCYEKMENFKDAYAISKRRAALEEKFREN